MTSALRFLVLCLLACAVHGSGLSPAAAQPSTPPVTRPAQSMAPPVATPASVTTVNVDGLNGGVQYHPDWNGVLYPGDIVTIKVVNADLLHYSYTIGMEATAIQRLYYVNGIAGGVLKDATLAGAVASSGSSTSSFTATCLDPALKGSIKQSLNSVTAQIWEIVRYIDSINVGSIRIIDTSRVNWEKAMTDSIEKKLLQANIAQKTLGSIGFELKILEHPGECGKAEGCCPEAINRIMKAVIDQVNNQSSLLETAITILKRWNYVVNTTDPVIEQRFRVEDTPMRYIAKIMRSPVPTHIGTTPSQPAVTGEGANGTSLKKESAMVVQSADNAPFAVVRFDGHTRSNLVFSIGFARHSSDQTTEFVPYVRKSTVHSPVYIRDTLIRSESVVVDSTFYRAEHQSGGAVITPIIMLGFYLGGVDDMDPANSAFGPLQINRFFFFLGTDIAFPPKQYFLGVNYDFPSGVTAGAGITHRRVETIDNDWDTNTDINEATKTKLGKPPVDATTELSVFYNISFRPVFLSTLFGALKKLISG